MINELIMRCFHEFLFIQYRGLDKRCFDRSIFRRKSRRLNVTSLLVELLEKVVSFLTMMGMFRVLCQRNTVNMARRCHVSHRGFYVHIIHHLMSENWDISTWLILIFPLVNHVIGELKFNYIKLRNAFAPSKK
jgi:hypothetical protein